MKAVIALLILCITTLSACNLLGGGENGSPRTIVFSGKDDGGRYQIYSMREDGSGIRQLTNGEYSSTAPAWSPDGRRIAYAAYTPKLGGETLQVMDADGGNKQPLVTNPRTGSPQLGSYPAWSPDGSRLAFEQCLNCEAGGSNHELFIADLQSGAVDTLTHHTVADRHPTWSPDGQQIAFASNRDYFDADSMRWRQELYVIDVDGSKLQRLTETGFVRKPIWKTNTNIITYSSSHEANGLFFVDTTSKNISELKTNLPSELRLFPVKWSSSNDSLLIAAINYPVYSFFVLEIETGVSKPIPFEPVEMLGVDWFTNHQ